MLIFIRLIFVAAIDYENIFTTKISRFTVYALALGGGGGDDEMSKYENKGGKAIVCVRKHTISRGLGACFPRKFGAF